MLGKGLKSFDLFGTTAIAVAATVWIMGTYSLAETGVNGGSNPANIQSASIDGVFIGGQSSAQFRRTSSAIVELTKGEIIVSVRSPARTATVSTGIGTITVATDSDALVGLYDGNTIRVQAIKGTADGVVVSLDQSRFTRPDKVVTIPVGQELVAVANPIGSDAATTDQTSADAATAIKDHGHSVGMGAADLTVAGAAAVASTCYLVNTISQSRKNAQETKLMQELRSSPLLDKYLSKDDGRSQAGRSPSAAGKSSDSALNPVKTSAWEKQLQNDGQPKSSPTDPTTDAQKTLAYPRIDRSARNEGKEDEESTDTKKIDQSESGEERRDTPKDLLGNEKGADEASKGKEEQKDLLGGDKSPASKEGLTTESKTGKLGEEEQAEKAEVSEDKSLAGGEEKAEAGGSAAEVTTYAGGDPVEEAAGSGGSAGGDIEEAASHAGDAVSGAAASATSSLTEGASEAASSAVESAASATTEAASEAAGTAADAAGSAVEGAAGAATEAASEAAEGAASAASEAAGAAADAAGAALGD